MTSPRIDAAALQQQFQCLSAASDIAGMRALLPFIDDHAPEAAQSLNCLGHALGVSAQSPADLQEGIDLLVRAAPLACEPVLQAKILSNLSTFRLWALDYAGAAAAAQAVLEVELPAEQHWLYGFGHFYQAYALELAGDDALADHHYEQAQRYGLTISLRPLSHVGRAQVAARRGDHIAVDEHLRSVQDPSMAPAVLGVKAELYLAWGDHHTATNLARESLLGYLAVPFRLAMWPAICRAEALHAKVQAALAQPVPPTVTDGGPGAGPSQPPATGNTLPELLEALVRMIEQRSSGATAAVYLLDTASNQLRVGAASRLLAEQLQVDDGWDVDRFPGISALAIGRRAPVIVPDLSLDPAWSNMPAILGVPDLRACIAHPLLGSDGSVLGACALYYPAPLGSTADVDLGERFARMAVVAIESHRTESALAEQQRLYRLVTEHASDLISIIRMDGSTTYVSPSAEWILGATPEAVVRRGLTAWVSAADLPAVQRAIQSARQGEPSSACFRARRADDSEVWLEALHRPIRDSAGHVVLVASCSRDITERKRIEKQLTFQALHDPLTGLYNRAYFVDRLQQALDRAQRHHKSLAVLFLDMDNFKVINDSLGHESGDRLLCRVADRLLTCLRAEDTAARFGGDEFTILLEDVKQEEEATRVAERIARMLREPFRLDGHELFATFSIGIAVSAEEAQEPGDLLRDADAAMYEAKNSGKARFALAKSTANALVRERLALETDLRRAVQRNELRLHFQPLVDLTSGRLVGVEALVRWLHPDRGLVMPAEFIPVAEETGMIVPIGQWVLKQACRQMQAWRRQGVAPPAVSVNLSRRQFQHVSLVADIAQVLEETDIDPRCLHLEITESAMMEDTEAATRALGQLKALGIGLAMDDFGTGYSSLAYLKRFPIDVLKIDRTFIRGLADDPDDAAIVHAMVTLAQTLKLKVVAEGVESEAHLVRLRELGCDHGQGYYFAPPLTLEGEGRLPELFPI